MKARFLLLDVDYPKNSKNVLRLFGKDEKGKHVFVLVDFDPYLYALPKKITKNLKNKIFRIKEPKVKKIEETERVIGPGKKKLLKIYCHSHGDIQKIRDVLKGMPEIGHNGCFEYAINFYRRYLIDNLFSPGEWLEVEAEKTKSGLVAKKINKIKARKTSLKEMAFDIETYEKGSETGIVMISFYGKNLRKVLTYKKGSYPDYVETLKDEKQMLQRFVQLVKKHDPDIIYTYNGDSFDFKLLKERAGYLKVKLDLGRDHSQLSFTRRARASSAEIQGRIHIDLFSFVSNVLAVNMQTETLGLDEVSSEILGDSKIDFQLEEIFESWEKGKIKKLAEYCLKDSQLTFRLGQNLLPQIMELSIFVGQTPFDVSRMLYSQMVEWYLSRRAFAGGRIIPNQPKFDEIRERRTRSPFTGGFVKEPVEGLHRNIAILDFTSLYPTIIASHNISPETLKKGTKKTGFSVPDSDLWFSKKPEGFVSRVIGDLVKRRQELKKTSEKNHNLELREKALKIIANATYGYLAYPGSKWYCFECAQASAAWGRFYIKRIIKDAESNGFQVIYSDTDSVFLKSEKIKEKTNKFLKKTNKYLPGIMELDLQGFYKRGIFVSTKVGRGAKKRYALINDKGELTIRGFETVRRDWCNLAKDMQRKILRMVLDGNDLEKAVDYVMDTVERVKKGRADIKDLVIREHLTKRLKDYDQIGPHVIAARKMKEHGESVGPGMVVMFVISRGSGSISQRAEPVKNMKIKDVDVDYYINNQIIPVALRVLGVLGITESELKGEGKQTGLKKFDL